MAIANNNPKWGDKGSSFAYELGMLKSQQEIIELLTSIAGGGGSATQTAYGPIRATAAGSIPANVQSLSVYNAGSADGVFNGGTIKSGEQMTWSASNKFGAAMNYDATGTELVINYVI